MEQITETAQNRIDNYLAEINENESIFSKIRDFFSYRIIYPVKDWIFNKKTLISNIKLFWEPLKNYRDWDYQYAVDMLIFCLENLKKCIENGHEERVSANKKVKKIGELIEMLRSNVFEAADDLYEQMREKDCSEQERCEARDKFVHSYFSKLCRILEGQKSETVLKKYKAAMAKYEKENKHYPTSEEEYRICTEIFDGTGIDRWWD